MKYTAVALIGLPGAGKGTQAERLVKTPNIRHISTGDLAREAAKDLILRAKFWPQGDTSSYFSDPQAIELVTNALTSKGYLPNRDLLLLDGVPRTPAQAHMLEAHVNVAHVVWFHISERMASANMAMRGERSYDRDHAVQRMRFRDFGKETAPVRGYYPQQIITDIFTEDPCDGLREKSDIETEIRSALRQNSALQPWFP